jgi:ribosomal protein S18 acetylase RimI-like enzyme
VVKLPPVNKIKIVDINEVNFDLIPRPANKKFSCQECFYWIGKKDGRLDQQAQKKKWFSRKGEHHGSVGKLLYAEGEEKPIGFIQFGPIKEFNTAQLFYLKNGDSPKDGWCITCLMIDNRYRGKGLAGQLVKKVLNELKKKGVKSVDTYPAVKASIDDTSAGTVELWQKFGFQIIAEGSREVVMRKELHGKPKQKTS